ncbi:MAG TPA: enolase C-terminal domain-like protein [Thermoanaerobaculia bacterium]|nr:enolase C-terminal domain-like protein [Thermoanaerobaculia bacterium]
MPDAIHYWRYELLPKRRLSGIAANGPRHGALLRIDDGFADVHPWPELGDAPLDTQLAMLARGETTALTRASLAFAAIDASARRDNRRLFEGLTIPRSHWPGADPPDGFDTVKLKSVDHIPDHVRLRIDFNATLAPDEFVRIAATLPRERIDFIEDPCPYDAATWRELRARTGMRLALDRGTGTEDVDVIVVKPAVQKIPDSDAEIVVTSYMDHPLGQLCAAYAAAKASITATCGLVTHVLFEPDVFIERMRIDGTRLIPPDGNGFGFDDLLERLPWRSL